MKKLLLHLGLTIMVVTIFLLPSITFSQTTIGKAPPPMASKVSFKSLQEVGIEIRRVIEFIIIPIIIGLALLIFLWGILLFIKDAGNDEKRKEGRQFMFWGIIGLAVMISVWGLVQIITGTLGQPLELPTLDKLKK